MGKDSVEPFLAIENKHTIMLALKEEAFLRFVNTE
jgi:hypothetical protein